MYNGTIIIEDTQTQSLWSPFTGEALYGPLKGAHLEPVQVFQATWKEWKVLHPETLVVVGEPSDRVGHCEEMVAPTTKMGPGPDLPPLLTETLTADFQGPAEQLVLGIHLGEGRAYRLDRLHEAGPVVNVVIGDRGVVIFARTKGWFTAVFDREVDGRRLEFRASKTNPDSSFEDVETGSTWDTTGHATQGPLAGRSLKAVHSYIEKWYAWRQYHPKAVYDDSIRPSPSPGDSRGVSIIGRRGSARPAPTPEPSPAAGGPR